MVIAFVMSNLIVLGSPIFIVFTVRSLIQKRKDGEVRLKTAISMFIFGAILPFLFIFGNIPTIVSSFYNYGIDAISTLIAIWFVVTTYMIVGGKFLMRKNT